MLRGWRRGRKATETDMKTTETDGEPTGKRPRGKCTVGATATWGRAIRLTKNRALPLRAVVRAGGDFSGGMAAGVMESKDFW